MTRVRSATRKVQGQQVLRFLHAETGSLTVFSVMVLLLMIMMGGIAVDVMKYEARRTSLQNTLDRSTLAAAALTQDRDPEAVVNDYFLKAGVFSSLRSVTVTQGFNFRNVNATAGAQTNPLFLSLMGISSFDALGASTAEQRINNVEIMLVLDVSGSMAANSKLFNLQTAAKEFVATVLANDVEHKISIGIVPFNGQVNLGPALGSFFTLTDSNSLDGIAPQAGVHCVDLPPTAYSTYAISTTTPLSMTANVDTYSGSSSTTPSEANKWCPGSTTFTGSPAGSGGNIVRMPQQDVGVLQGYISGLAAVGATSINAGIKWGMTLLDPSMLPLYDSHVTAGTMPATMELRPLPYNTENAMKVIVLMTDGENFAEDRATQAYKSGASPIWLASDAHWSIHHSSRVDGTNATTLCNSRPYWVVHLAAWQSRPWNGATPAGTDCYVASPATAYADTTQQTWPQVWSALRMQYVAQSLYATPLGGTMSTYLNLMRTQTATTTMDSQMQAACTAAKTSGVIICGIAFEAPVNGQTQIQNCSTSAAHYFNASGIQISTAFAAIANNISQLRLTQ